MGGDAKNTRPAHIRPVRISAGLFLWKGGRGGPSGSQLRALAGKRVRAGLARHRRVWFRAGRRRSFGVGNAALRHSQLPFSVASLRKIRSFQRAVPAAVPVPRHLGQHQRQPAEARHSGEHQPRAHAGREPEHGVPEITADDAEKHSRARAYLYLPEHGQDGRTALHGQTGLLPRGQSAFYLVGFATRQRFQQVGAVLRAAARVAEVDDGLVRRVRILNGIGRRYRKRNEARPRYVLPGKLRAFPHVHKSGLTGIEHFLGLGRGDGAKHSAS